MEKNTSSILSDFIISFFLPDGMTDRFEIVRMEEEPNTGKAKVDALYDIILNKYPLAADGTKLTVEFGVFFKDGDGHLAIDCDSDR